MLSEKLSIGNKVPAPFSGQGNQCSELNLTGALLFFQVRLKALTLLSFFTPLQQFLCKKFVFQARTIV